MIAKKKGFYLGLLLSLLGVGSAVQAYKVTIKNTTPNRVRYFIDTDPTYMSVDGELRSNGKITEEIGGNLVELRASVRQGTRSVRATSYQPTRVERKNQSFTISGNETAGYTVKKDSTYRR